MSAVTQIIKIFTVTLIIAALSACSDGGGSSTEITEKESEFNTPYFSYEGHSGSASIEFTFISTVTGEVTYDTFDISAAGKSDYSPKTDSIEVEEGAEYTIQISVYGDEEVEGNELFGLNINYEGQTLSTLYGLIVNDDYPEMSITTTSVLEGDAGTSLLTFTFSLTAEVVDPYIFLVTTPTVATQNNNPTEGTFYAIPDVDFQAVEQDIKFEKGTSEISIDVIVYADNVVEMDERVQIQVSPPSDSSQSILNDFGVIRTDDEIDDDFFQIAPPTGEDAVTEGSYDASNPEDTQWSQINYRVTLDKQELSQIVEAQTLQIRLEVEDEDPTSQWATIDEDFCGNIPDDTNNPCQDTSTYVFDPTEFAASGQDYFEIPFYVRKDLDVEAGDEKIRVYLENDQGISFAESIYIIKEDDFPELLVSYTYTEAADGSEIEGTFTYFMEEGIEINEPSSGGEGVLTLKLDLSAEQSANFTLKHQVSNDESTSIDVNDYTATPSDETTDIPAGTTKGVEIEIRIKDDSLYESTENIELEVEGIGVVLIAIKDTDFPALEFKKGATVISSGTLTEIQEQAVTETNIAGNNLVFDYNLALANAVVARSEFELSYELLSYRPDESVQGCDYLSQDQAVWGEDYNVYLGGVVTEPEAPVIFNQGQSSVSLRIEVVNDSLVECEEYLSLKFILGTDVDGGTVTTASTTTANFSIDNKDKTTLSVSGWSVEEGSSDDVIPTQTSASYILNLDQTLKTTVLYSLKGPDADSFSCTGSEVSGLGEDIAYSFNGIDQIGNITVGVTQDNLVEPDEICQLIIKNTDLVDVVYLDTTNAFATGVIENDDSSNISVNLKSTTCDQSSEIYENCSNVYGLTTSHDIAENVDAISVDFTFSGNATNTNDGSDGDYTFHKQGEADQYIPSVSSSATFKDAGASFLSSSEVIFQQNIIEDNRLETEESYTIGILLSASVDDISINDLNNSVTGVIPENGGTLQITLHYASDLQEGLALPSSTRYPISISTNIALSEDIGSIYLDVAQLACKDGDIYCTELSSDFNISSTPFLIHEAGKSTDIIDKTDNFIFDKFEVIPDPTLEKDENIELQFSISGGTGITKRLFENENASVLEDGLVSLVLVNDDDLEVTVTKVTAANSSTELNEGDTEGAVNYNVELSTDIASNYPEIYLQASDSTAVKNGSNINYAKQSDNDYSLSGLILHDGSTATSKSDQAISITVKADNRLETDEVIAAALSLNDTSAWVSLNTSSGVSLLEHTIENDDELIIGIKKSTADTSQAEGNLGGGSQITETIVSYVATLSSDIAPNFPNITWSTDTGESAGNATPGIGNDYLLTLPVIHTENTGSVDTPKTDLSIGLAIYGENILEPTELIEEQLGLETTGPSVSIQNSANVVTNVSSGGKISYTINNDDQLAVTITKNAAGSSTTEGDLSGGSVTNTDVAYTVNLSTDIAANYPSIDLAKAITTGSAYANETSDFTLDVSELHTQNINSASITPAGDQTMTLKVKGEDTLEPDEIIEVGLAISTTDTQSLTLSGPSNITLTNSGTVITTTDLGIKTAGSKISHTIANDDQLNITMTASATLQGNEGNDTANPTDIEYAVTLSNDIAANYPSISLATTELGFSTAIFNTDYTLDVPSIHSQDLTDGAADTAAVDNLKYVVKIKGEAVLELDEDIALSIAEASLSNDILINNGNDPFLLNYKILNDDTLTVSVTPNTNIVSNEGNDSGLSVGAEYQTVDYTISIDTEIAEDYPAFDLTFTNGCSVDCATINDDYIFDSTAIEIHDGAGNTASDATLTSKTLSTVKDNVVEKTEEINYTLGFSKTLNSFVKINFNGLESSALTHTITNDDFIGITFNNSSNLEEGGDVTFTVLPYESSGLTGTEISQALPISDNSSFYASGLSSDIGNITPPAHTIVASLVAASSGTLFSIVDDLTIEPSETFTLPIDLSAHSEYVRVQGSEVSASADIVYTIEDNDKLHVELEKFHSEDFDGTSQPYNINVCYSSNPVIQGANSVIITPTLSAIASAGIDVLTTKAIDIAVDLTDDTSPVTLDLDSGFSANGAQYCKQIELFKTVADTTVEGTEWMNVELNWSSTADSRFTTTNIGGGGVDVAVIDNDFPYMTQTGASKCIDNTGDLVTNTSNCVGTGNAAARPRQDYTRAEQSNGTHPAQHFTLISNGYNSSIPDSSDGDPSLNTPSQSGSTFNGDNGYCLFDSYSNNVWLIGGFDIDTNLSILSTERIPFSSSVGTDKTALTLQTEAQDRLTWCGMTSGAFYQWRLPTVDELLTTLNIEYLRGANEMSANSNVVLSSYFQNHFVDLEETGNDLNATQGDCELASPNSCTPDPVTETSTITSYYWTSEYCLETDAIADSVAAGASKNTAIELRAAATQARADSDAIQSDATKTDQEKADANNAANTAEGLADTAEADAETAETTANASIKNQTHAWAVDFASGQLMCLNKESSTAHVRLVYKEVE